MDYDDSLHRRISALTEAQRALFEQRLAAVTATAGEVVAYVVPHADAMLQPEDVLAWAAARLPSYMLPSSIEFLSDLPMLPSGKVDQRALPAPRERRGDSTAPRDHLEAGVARVFSEFLGAPSVGAHDDFFALGGNSLQAARIVARLRDALRTELTVRALFDNPTVARLASVLRESAAAASLGIVHVPRDQEFEASPAQRRFWVLDQLEGAALAYHVPGAVRLRGTLDVTALEWALNEVIRRHEALRTGLVEVDGRLLQRIEPDARLSLERIDLNRTPGSERAEAVLERMRAVYAQPFDLSRPPLLRAELVQLAEDDWTLLLCFHHAACDGWSISQFTRELVRLYADKRCGAMSSLAEPRFQFVDIWANYEAELAAGQAEQDLAYWRRQLSGAPETLHLATDHPRPEQRSSVGSRARVALSKALSDQLREQCQRDGVTPFMALLAAWQVLLARYSRQDDILVGTPVAGRLRAEADEVVGCFVNTLVLRTRVDGAQTSEGLLKAVRETVLSAHAHQALPFERLVDSIAPARVGNRTPLFQACFVLEDTAETIAPPEEISEIEVLDVHNGGAKFDLTMSLAEKDGVFEGAIEYAVELWEPATIERMARHFETLVSGLISHPQATIASIPTLAGDELEAALATTVPRAHFEITDCLHERFMLVAARTPDAVAVSCDGQTLTYRELLLTSQRVASRLRRVGVGSQARVGLMVERSNEAIVGLLGILLAGAAYVPLDPDYPDQRLQFVLADAACSVVVTLGDPGSSVDGCTHVDLKDPTLANEVPLTATGASLPEDLCYVLYTSGSTGQPKGCEITHAHVMRLFEATQERFDFGPSDVWTLFHSLAFDFSVWEVWGALLHGGRLVVVPYLTSRAPEDFHELLVSEGVTILNQTPSAFLQLMAADEQAGASALALREVIFGGEALDLRSLGPWVSRHPTVPRLVNMYGITETTVHVTWRAIDPIEVEHAKTSVIGTPLSDLSLCLVDQHGQLVPVGVPGEIWVGGAGVARGYLHRKQLTQERFLSARWQSDRPAVRTYRSGDLARRTAEGELEYLGRLDKQVKIRGFRIELGEIESALRALDFVADVAVLATTGAQGRKFLACFAVLEDDEAIERLRLEARRCLPGYMVPATFDRVVTIPLTHNGKIDQHALLALHSLPESEAQREQPTDDVERVIAKAWGDALGVENVGRHDNFFELGGDSILAIQAASNARTAGVEVSLKEMFQQQTVAKLAATARGAHTRAEPAAEEGSTPLSPIQRWFFDLDVAHPHYWNQAIRVIRPTAPGASRLDSKQLVRALDEVVARHGALRAGFVPDRSSGAYQQEIASAVDVSSVVYWHDLRARGDESYESIVASVAGELHASFDLAEPPLLRVAAFDRGPGQDIELILIAHHLVVDAVSWRVFVDELSHALAGSKLPPVSAGWQSVCSLLDTAPISESDRDFWRDQASAPIHSPFASACDDDSEADLREVSYEFDGPETVRLFAGARAYAARPDDLLLAALGEVLTSAAEGSVLVEVERHGRDAIGSLNADATIGWFTVLLPVVLSSTNTADRAVKATKEKVRNASSRAQAVSLMRARGELPSNLSLAEVCFNFLGTLGGSERTGAQEMRLHEGATGRPRHSEGRRTHRLEVTASIADGELRVSFSYGASLEEAGVRALADAHRVALSRMVAFACSAEGGGRTPSDFPLVRLEQERIDLLAGPAGTRRALEDVYPLSPVQQGLLVRTLAVAGAAEVEQARYELVGSLDEDAFVEAWRTVVARHPALRTSFAWDALDAPLQIVDSSADLPFAMHDLTALSSAEQARRIEALITEDRHAGFDLGKPPLMRLNLVRYGQDRSELVWSHHHLILDGWSVQRVLYEVTLAYGEALAGRSSGVLRRTPPRFRDWIQWWKEADHGATERYWRAQLSGIQGPTTLGIERVPPAPAVLGLAKGLSSHHESNHHLSQEVSQALRALSTQLGLTIGGLVEAAWGLVLGRASGDADVVFGTTVSGRSVDLPGMVEMVGMLINVVPVRVKIDPDQGLEEWLTGLHRAALERREHEHAAPIDLHVWSSVSPSVPLFDSLVVFENFPVQVRDMSALPGGLRVRPLGGSVHSGYKLTLLVAPGDQLEIVAAYDLHALDTTCVEALVGDLIATLTALADAGGREPGLRSVGEVASVATRRRWVDGNGKLWRRRNDEDEMLGEVRDVVCIGGIQVHPEEIRALLLAHPDIDAARVHCSGPSRRLRASVVLQPLARTSVPDLKVFLRTRLPHSLVPSLAIVDALTDDSGDELSVDHEIVAPRNHVEQVIASIWADLLDLPEVSATESFFDLGGQSVAVVKMLSRLRRAFGVSVPAEVVFQLSTVEAIAKWVADRPVLAGAAVLSGHAPAATDDLPPLERQAPRDHWELSPYQLPEFYFAQLAPDSPMYNQLSCDVLLVGEVDRDALRAAWQTIVGRHAVFRTRFDFADGRPVQVVAPSHEVELEDIWIDKTSVPEEDFELETRRVAEQYAATALDFFNGPMFVLKIAAFSGNRHLVILLTNHVLWDEVSSLNFGREIVEAYNAHRAGREPDLAPVPLDYVDYATWVNRCVAEGRFERQRQYWLKTFADCPEPFELPTDFPRPHQLTFVGSDVSGQLPPALVRRLHAELPRSYPGVTLSMFLHAALNVLLARLSGSDDIVIGMPIANRGHEELEHVMGAFATGMPMRCRVALEHSAAEVVAHTRDVTIGALDNYAYPSVLAIQEINPAWDPSRGRLFTVMYGLQHDKTRYWRELHWDGLETKRLNHLSEIGPLHATARTDLRLIVEPLGDDIIYSWSYNSDLFRGETVERFAEYYERIIEQLLNSPERPVGDLCLEGEERRMALDSALQGPRVQLPEGDAISLVARAAALYPDRVAVVDGERRLSYRELLESANGCAQVLREHGVGTDDAGAICDREDLVALYLEPSIEAVVSILGTLIAGAAYVPLSMEAPAARLEATLAKSNPKLIVARSRQATAAFDGGRVVVDTGTCLAKKGEMPARHYDPQRRAVVFFTSGTTGDPKGIEVEHLGLVNLLTATQRCSPLTRDDAILWVAPYHFDASLLELLWPLTTGAHTVVVSGDETRDAEAVVGHIERSNVTVLQTVPTMLDALLELSLHSERALMPSLRHVICGSAPLTRTLRDRFYEVFSCSLANHYGPTEATVDVSRTDAAIAFDGDVVPLGRPLDNTNVQVVDARGVPVAPGVIGEICVSGPGVARGYLEDPERTASRFGLDHSQHPPVRTYATGDLGRVTPDGTICFVGRSDRQVKVRGNRVELDEIEAKLAQHASVASCAVRHSGSRASSDALTAYVELRDGGCKVDGLRVCSLEQRPELALEMTRLHAGAWPDFFQGDPALSELWPRLATERPGYQLLLLDEESRVVAVVNTAPISWSGTAADLPDGWSGALRDALGSSEAGHDTLVVFAGVVSPDAGKRRLGASLLRSAKALAAAHGLTRVLAPVRPTGKAAHPDVDFTTWCHERREDGAARDSWIRTHERLGARALRIDMESQIVRGTLDEWRTWTGHDFDMPGDHHVAGALGPVRADLDAGIATYADPCLWMEHPADEKQNALALVTPTDLRLHLRSSLPDYMVPEHMRVLDRMPLMSNGKVDMRKLPEPGTTAKRAVAQPPSTPLQHALLKIFQEALALDSDVGIGVRDDFFELGGHSIRAMQVIARVEERFGPRIALREFISTPTVLGLERHLSESHSLEQS